jgi:septation ring formation regulator EzrA
MLLLDLDEAQKQIKELSDHFQQINDQLEEVVKKKKQVDSRYYKVLSGVRLVISDIKKNSIINK